MRMNRGDYGSQETRPLTTPYNGNSQDKPNMRKFDTGAIRDDNADKYDYKGFISEQADKRFAEYMHKHRKQADGGMRGSDNWKLGIPTSAYEESLYRHTKEFFQLLEQMKFGPVDLTDQAMEVAQAMRFNLQGWVHETLKRQEAPNSNSSAGLNSAI